MPDQRLLPPENLSPRPALRGEEVRVVILDAALRIFCRKGIAITTIDEVVREAGIARMTVYHHFRSKDQLVLAALEREGVLWRKWFFSRIAKSRLAPRDRLLSVFDIIQTWFDREDYFGCAFMNAILEQRTQNSATIAITAAHKQPVLEQLEALAVAAGAPDPASLAAQIDLLMNGAIVNAVILKSVEPAAQAKAIAAHLIRATCAGFDPKE